MLRFLLNASGFVLAYVMGLGWWLGWSGGRDHGLVDWPWARPVVIANFSFWPFGYEAISEANSPAA